jgi:hypothetical protein
VAGASCSSPCPERPAPALCESIVQIRSILIGKSKLAQLLALGIQLGDGKHEERWDVLWTGNQVSFETTDLKIIASKFSEN